MCDICCLGIHQSSTVQRYHIYRLTEYIRHMFIKESPRGNLLIQMQLILSCKVHILVRLFVFESFPIHAGDCWILKRCEWKMKSCDFYEELWLLWNVATFMKSCHFYEKLRLLWKVVTFMKSCDFYEELRLLWKLWLLWEVVTFPNGCHFSKK